jgi:hypothetical protein
LNPLLFRKFKFLFIVACIAGFASIFGGVTTSFADVVIDIRSDGVLIDDQNEASYVVSIDNCLDLVSLSVLSGETDTTVAPSQATPIPGSLSECEYRFSGAGVGRLDPQVTLSFTDGSTQTHEESFQVEKTAPQISFEGVGIAVITGADGLQHQYLQVSVNANDDVDITYVGFSVTGLRASDLRAAGGIIAEARKSAFADTGGTKRVYPGYEGQERFTMSIAISPESGLDSAQIAHDGVVLADIMVVDSSGNQNSISRISFTGKDVVEEASNLNVNPSEIIFTNLLETSTIIPSVDFQFRGTTPLPGPGTGIDYVSSHPELIAVSSGGVVYPLVQTGEENVVITVSYPGIDPVQIPVTADLTKQLVSLKAEGLSGQDRFVLDRLNTRFSLPDILGVFNDGTQAEISSQYPND